MTASVVSVNVVHELRPGYFHDTAIDKRPVDGPVEVTPAGLAGDTSIDSSHGGPDRAVYVYADEDADYWAEELGREIPTGTFGENVRVHGLDVTGAKAGERWRIGDVLLEVRRPRTPCQNLALRMGIEDFHLRFNDSGRVGAMCGVVEPGSIAAGQPVIVELTPDHPVTIGAISTGETTPEDYQALLDSGVHLASWLRNKAQRSVTRAARAAG